mmetsp:Transcript_64409/g.73949  ORF Transcript_64409/g.73949 Transcript_64409/m.73949 type:complete len:117 (-) Transcript_64409:1516-1866(-)
MELQKKKESNKSARVCSHSFGLVAFNFDDFFFNHSRILWVCFLRAVLIKMMKNLLTPKVIFSAELRLGREEFGTLTSKTKRFEEIGSKRETKVKRSLEGTLNKRRSGVAKLKQRKN